MWTLAVLVGCPYVPPTSIADLDGDGLEAIRFGGRDCDDEDASIGDCDVDGDGQRSLQGGGEDCDDEDPSVLVGAVESCDGKDNDCDGLTDDLDPDVVGQSSWFRDDDGDGVGAGSAVLSCALPLGHAALDGDCNDDIAEIRPGVPERCDAVDWNCDGSADDGAFREWFADADEDGFGDPGAPVASTCDTVQGAVTNPFDCDDSDPLAHPRGVLTPDFAEVCDGIDNDCNGMTDGEDPFLDPVGALAGFADLDGDGFGDAGAVAVGCALDVGFSTRGDDCDDGDATINPDAVERCDELGDEDCDGLANSADPDNDGELYFPDADGDGIPVEAGAVPLCEPPGVPGLVPFPGFFDCNDASADVVTVARWFVDGDGDGVGHDPDAFIESCFFVAGRSLLSTDCDDTNPAVRPGLAEQCDGIDNDCDGLVDNDAPGLAFGFLDVDGDGFGAGVPGSFCDGVVALAGDCNDADPLVNPAATERCSDGGPVDEDCDGLVDDADPSAELDAWFEDVDLDGFGEDGTEVFTCSAPPGRVDRGGDCDPTDPARYFDRYVWTPAGTSGSLGDTPLEGLPSRGTIGAILTNGGRCRDVPLTIEVAPQSGAIQLGGTEDLRLLAGGANDSAPIRLAGNGATLVAAAAFPEPTRRPLTLSNLTLQLVEPPIEPPSDTDEPPSDPSSGWITVAPSELFDDKVQPLPGLTLDDVELIADSTTLTRTLVEGVGGSVAFNDVRMGRAFVDVQAPLVEGSLSRFEVSRSDIHVGEGSTPVFELSGEDTLVSWTLNHFTSDATSGESPWLAQFPDGARVTSSADTYEGPGGSDPAPVVAFGAGSEWVSLRDTFSRVGDGWSQPTTVEMFESRFVELDDWELVGMVVDSAFVEFVGTVGPAPEPEDEPEDAFHFGNIHVGGAWPYGSANPDVFVVEGDAPIGNPNATPTIPGVSNSQDDLVAWRPDLEARFVMPYPRNPPPGAAPFLYGRVLDANGRPINGTRWDLDPNGDDLPSAWIVFHASTPDCRDDLAGLVDPDADPDGDGASNKAEYAAGTWPCLGSSFPATSSVPPAP